MIIFLPFQMYHCFPHSEFQGFSRSSVWLERRPGQFVFIGDRVRLYYSVSHFLIYFFLSHLSKGSVFFIWVDWDVYHGWNVQFDHLISLDKLKCALVYYFIKHSVLFLLITNLASSPHFRWLISASTESLCVYAFAW